MFLIIISLILAFIIGNALTSIFMSAFGFSGMFVSFKGRALFIIVIWAIVYGFLENLFF